MRSISTTIFLKQFYNMTSRVDLHNIMLQIEAGNLNEYD